MSKTNVLTLVTDFSIEQEDASSVDAFYNDTLQDVAQLELMTGIRLIEVTGGTPTYTIPDDIVMILGMFYDDIILGEADVETLKTYAADWQAVKGTPMAYTTKQETKKTFRLFPEPVVSSRNFSFILGAPLGQDFPEYSVGVIHTETRDDRDNWLDIPIALRVLEKEFNRESDHQDLEFVRQVKIFADLLFGAVGGKKTVRPSRT